MTSERLGATEPADAGSAQSVPADGGWYNITPPLSGAHTLEVVAGVGGRQGQGKYALLYAIAMNAFNPRGWVFNFLRRKTPITIRHAYYRHRVDRLSLRWARCVTPDCRGPAASDDQPSRLRRAWRWLWTVEGRDDRHYVLQLRSQRDYGPGDDGEQVRIGFRVTSLWPSVGGSDSTDSDATREDPDSFVR